MANLEYKNIKLKTGEMILCGMDHQWSVGAEAHVTIYNPVLTTPKHETSRDGRIIGESFALRPWMGLSDNHEFVINTDLIVTIGNLKREIQQQYIEYTAHINEVRQQVNEEYERSDAADSLLQDMTIGVLYYVDEIPCRMNGEDHYDHRETK